MSERPTIIGIGTVGIPVTDQDRAVEFYVGRLGFEKRMDAPLPQLGSRWITVAPPGSDVTIALVLAGKGVPAGVKTGVRLLTSDAAGLHAAMAELGIDVNELLRWPGVPPMYAFHDPDGNVLEIVETSGVMEA